MNEQLLQKFGGLVAARAGQLLPPPSTPYVTIDFNDYKEA